jgi:hypothetical protein
LGNLLERQVALFALAPEIFAKRRQPSLLW